MLISPNVSSSKLKIVFKDTMLSAECCWYPRWERFLYSRNFLDRFCVMQQPTTSTTAIATTRKTNTMAVAFGSFELDVSNLGCWLEISDNGSATTPSPVQKIDGTGGASVGSFAMASVVEVDVGVAPMNVEVASTETDANVSWSIIWLVEASKDKSLVLNWPTGNVLVGSDGIVVGPSSDRRVESWCGSAVLTIISSTTESSSSSKYLSSI